MKYIFTLVLLLLVNRNFNAYSQTNKDVTLRLFVYEGYAPNHMIEKFKYNMLKKYNAKIDIQVQHVGDLKNQFNIIRGRAADVVSLTHNLLNDGRFQYNNKRLILPLNLENIPNIKKISQNLEFDDSRKVKSRFIPICQGPYGLAYNTAKGPPPESWNIFWNEKMKHNYTIGLHESLYNIGITALALGYPLSSLSNFELLNNPTFKEKLRTLVRNSDTLWIGVEKPSDLKGKTIAAVWGDSFKKLKQKGEHWKIANPKEGTFRWIDYLALSKSLETQPFKKKIAEEWINFSLSNEYQINYLFRDLNSYPVISGVKRLVNESERSRLDILDSKKWFLLPTLANRDRNGIEKLWKNALKAK